MCLSLQVVGGLFQADDKIIVNGDNCAQLFAHEATRVFHDRLVNNEDKTEFFKMLADNLHDYFKVSYSKPKHDREWMSIMYIVASVEYLFISTVITGTIKFQVKWTHEQLQTEPYLFADFLDESEAGNKRLYKPIKDKAKLLQSLEELYMTQNVNNTQAPQLVFFKDAVEHILRAARVFRQPGGHMLLVHYNYLIIVICLHNLNIYQTFSA